MQLPTPSNSLNNLTATAGDYPFLTRADNDLFLTSMGISATFRKNNELDETYEVITEDLTYSAVLKGPGLCPTEFICRRDIHKDTVSEHCVTGDLPHWALPLKEPQSSSTLTGGTSSVANSPSPCSSLSSVTTPVNVAMRSSPADIASPEGGSTSDSSSSGIYFTPMELPLTQANPRSPSPEPANHNFTIKIPARYREAPSPEPESTPKRKKLTAIFLAAKKKVEEAKIDGSKGQPDASATAVNYSALFSPYTSWLFEYTDEVYADAAALPLLASRISALGNASSTSASGSSGMPTQVATALPHAAPKPTTATSAVASTTHAPIASLSRNVASSSRSTPANALTITNSVVGPASSDRNKKRIVHEILSDDEDVPLMVTATSKQTGKGGASAAKGKAVAPSQKKRKSSN